VSSEGKRIFIYIRKHNGTAHTKKLLPCFASFLQKCVKNRNVKNADFLKVKAGYIKLAKIYFLKD